MENEKNVVAPSGKRRWIVPVAVAAIILFFAYFLIRRSPPAEQPQAAKNDASASPGLIVATPEQVKQLRIEPVREQTIDLYLEATGKVAFNEDRLTPVLTPYPGRVVEVLASKGDVVKGGQALLVMESPDLVSAVNDLLAAHSELDKALIALDIAQKAAERARRLNAQEALSTKDLQAAESDLARAQEDRRRAQSSLEVVRNRLVLLGKSAHEINEFENSYSYASPDPSVNRSLAAQIDRRVFIPAPIGGTIVDRKLGLGQYIKPDSPDPLFLIGDLSTVWVTVDIYENDLPRVRTGAPVSISVVGYPDRDFPAHISAISPTVDVTTRTVKVRCLVPNSNGVLKPEMFARVRVGEAVKQKVMTVPSNAILTEGSRSFVLVEASGGKFVRREVKAGREIGGDTAVEEGLAPTDRVVTSGVLLLSSAEGSKP
jgi:cobalt-zinc-cadmium efflux system membrane fusion protein